MEKERGKNYHEKNKNKKRKPSKNFWTNKRATDSSQFICKETDPSFNRNTEV